MSALSDFSLEDLDFLIEQKILDMTGDPDSDLNLKDEVIEELKQRKSSRDKTIAHKKIMEEYG